VPATRRRRHLLGPPPPRASARGGGGFRVRGRDIQQRVPGFLAPFWSQSAPFERGCRDEGGTARDRANSGDRRREARGGKGGDSGRCGSGCGWDSHRRCEHRREYESTHFCHLTTQTCHANTTNEIPVIFAP
jgi:hypothetical protein